METGSFKPVKNKALKIAGLIIVQALVSADAISFSLGNSSILGGFAVVEIIIAGLIFASVLALIDSASVHFGSRHVDWLARLLFWTVVATMTERRVVVGLHRLGIREKQALQ